MESLPQIRIPRSDPIRLDGGTIVDPRRGRLTSGVSILADQGRIVSIDAQEAVRADESARRIDITGKFVVPGYNDMHTHVLELEDPSGALVLMLAEGVTGFRQMSGSARLLEQRRAQRLPVGALAPAALELSGEVLTPLNAESITAVREEIARQKRQGADFIKAGLLAPEVFAAALREAKLLGIPILGHLQEGVDAIEAATAGFKSVEHLGPGATLWVGCSTAERELNAPGEGQLKLNTRLLRLPFMRAVFTRWLQTVLVNPAAFTAPAHVARLRRALDTFDEGKCQALIARFVALETWHVPTLVRLRASELADSQSYENSPCVRYMPPSTVRRWRKVTRRFTQLPSSIRETYSIAYARQLGLTKRLADAGARMMTGTDGGWFGSPGLTLQEEFQELGKAGLSPLRILQMTTVNAAEYLGRAATMGTIEPGRGADMVLLDANPLEHVDNLGRIAGVVRSGFHYPRRRLDELRELVAAGKGYPRLYPNDHSRRTAS